MKNAKLSKKQIENLISELWENSIFSKKSFVILSQIPKYKNLKLPKNLLKKIMFELSTIRNRHLITSSQQEKLRKKVVAIFGMSVGSHVAVTWMLQSRADCIKIIDFDKIAGSNLNRLKVGWNDVGKLKTQIVKKEILKINPFADVQVFNKGDKKDIKNVFTKNPKVDYIIDEIDDIEAKLTLRKFAKKYKIPLIQAADVGDNCILDIERYDLKKQPKFFLGRLPEIEKIDFNLLSSKDIIKLIIKLVGFDKNSEDMLYSLQEIGKTLSTWPQLGATASISGGICVTAIKKIALGEKIKSGRYYISLDDILVSDFNSPKKIEKRKKIIDKIKKNIGI